VRAQSTGSTEQRWSGAAGALLAYRGMPLRVGVGGQCAGHALHWAWCQGCSAASRLVGSVSDFASPRHFQLRLAKDEYGSRSWSLHLAWR